MFLRFTTVLKNSQLSVKSKVETTLEEPQLNPNEENALLIQNVLRAKSPPASPEFKNKIKRKEQMKDQTQTAAQPQENEKEATVSECCLTLEKTCA